MRVLERNKKGTTRTSEREKPARRTDGGAGDTAWDVTGNHRIWDDHLRKDEGWGWGGT